MWPIVRQARYLGRYQQIAQVLGRHGFGYLVEQLGLGSLLSLPRRVLRREADDPLSGPMRLRLALTDLGPTFIKLGQMLSTRPDLLPASFILELNKLQDTVPPFPAEAAIQTIESELGRPITELFLEFEEQPFAAASLGQVHRATLPDGMRVAVKVQRPEIAQTIATDLAILADLAMLAQERTTLSERYDLVELAWEFSAMLRAELDYRREGRNADRFRTNFASSPYVYIPKIIWECTSARVLTSELIVGIKINDIAGMEAAGMDRKRLARHSIELILKEIFTDGFFHGDPHPGNLFALPDEVIGAVDFGQAVSLDRTTTVNLLLLLAALTRYDIDGALRALQRLGLLAPRQIDTRLRRDMMRFMDGLVDRPLEDISARETIEELMALFNRHNLRMPAPLAMLLRAILMMEGTGVLIDPQLDVFGVARPYVTHALIDYASPTGTARRVADQARDVAEVMSTLPYQANDLLHQLAAGQLRIQVQQTESRRVTTAITQAGTRIALALVITAAALGLGLLAVATGVAGIGPTLLTIIVFGSIVILIGAGALLLINILRRE